MRKAQIEALIGFLGQSQNRIAVKGVEAINGSIKPVSDSERQSLMLEAGVEAGFWTDSLVFRSLHFRLKRITVAGVEYKGELPEPFTLDMSQSYIRSVLGEPVESSGPYRLPVVGLTGGWDTYHAEQGAFAGRKIHVHYLKSLLVDSIVFIGSE